MVNSEELICVTKYLTLQARCRINRCRHKRIRLYFAPPYEVWSPGRPCDRELCTRELQRHDRAEDDVLNA